MNSEKKITIIKNNYNRRINSYQSRNKVLKSRLKEFYQNIKKYSENKETLTLLETALDTNDMLRSRIQKERLRQKEKKNILLENNKLKKENIIMNKKNINYANAIEID